MGILKSLGYQVIEYKSGGKDAGKGEIINPTSKVDLKHLPIVTAIPGSKAVDLVGPQISKGRGRSLVLPPIRVWPPICRKIPVPARQMELLVLYPPGRPEQYSNVVRRIRETIDIPAQQILIEAMVLEISQTGLKKLGVEWELTTPFNGSKTDNISALQFGRLPSFSQSEDERSTLNLTVDDVFGHFQAKLQALIRDGQAEILSRPSVLTLDNRQASLRIGEEIPIAKAIQVGGNGDNVKLDFAYIPVGILLNVRPRISARSEEVSMQIDGVVSAQVPGEDLVVRDNNGDELGRAPRISTRRVQTYARVGNNTPFIIGGLISKDNTTQVDKVPLLGDIPVIKHLFRSTKVNTLKREVIIVLTPYVLPENQVIGRNIPKDEDAFDSFGNELFRDAYRIRAEDVFDLSFLTKNPQLRRMQRLANQVVGRNQDLADVYPFSHFAQGRIPGERILVFRQMYEVIKRKKIGRQVRNGQIIYFHPDETTESGFNVRFLDKMIAKYAQKAWYEMHPTVPSGRAPGNPYKILQDAGKAVALTYTMREKTTEADDILSQPVVDVHLVECPSDEAWSRLLWEMNQPDDQGRERHTILIREPDNVLRIKRALLLKRTVDLNATEGSLTLNNFTIGRQLLMPTVKEQKMYLIDSDTAKYFFYTEQYYPALQKQLQQDIETLKNALGNGKYSRYLTEPAHFEDQRTEARDQ